MSGKLSSLYGQAARVSMFMQIINNIIKANYLYVYANFLLADASKC